jgi:DNA-3-methyladenine glycosylase II
MAERQRKDHLSALVSAIVSQQLSTKAAATIFGRFVALFPDHHIPDAAAIAAHSDAVLRSVGLSGQKVSYPPRSVRADCRRSIESGRARCPTG